MAVDRAEKPEVMLVIAPPGGDPAQYFRLAVVHDGPSVDSSSRAHPPETPQVPEGPVTTIEHPVGETPEAAFDRIVKSAGLDLGRFRSTKLLSDTLTKPGAKNCLWIACRLVARCYKNRPSAYDTGFIRGLMHVIRGLTAIDDSFDGDTFVRAFVGHKWSAFEKIIIRHRVLLREKGGRGSMAEGVAAAAEDRYYKVQRSAVDK